MKASEFLATIEQLRMIRWHFGTKHTEDSAAIRTEQDGKEMCPLEVICYFKGGTLSWKGGRFYRPHMLEFPWQFGEALGLSEKDYHRIFRASDSDDHKASTEDADMRVALLKATRLYLSEVDFRLIKKRAKELDEAQLKLPEDKRMSSEQTLSRILGSGSFANYWTRKYTS